MSESDSGTDGDEMEYQDMTRLCKNNLGTIIRFPEWDTEIVRFSPHQYPEEHTTVVEASVWLTEETTQPRYMFSVVRGLESGSGRRSIVTDGNEYFEEYHEAVSRVEEIAGEYDGERIRWRDLPKRCFSPKGDEIPGHSTITSEDN